MWKLTEKYFTCDHCHQKFHYSCLKIGVESERKKNRVAKGKCPMCFLRVNLFYEVFGQPLDLFWATASDFGSRKLTIYSEKCQELVGEELQVQIRFLRIEGITLFSSEEKGLFKKEPNFSEVVISGDTLCNHMNEDLFINFDNLEEDGSSGSSLILAVCFAVKRLGEEEVRERLVHSSDENYLNQCFIKGATELKIDILNKSGKVVEKPGRGIDCNHEAIFDLYEFIHRVTANHAGNQCSICHKKCRVLVVDRCVERELKKIREIQEGNRPSTIYYQKSGSFRWGEHSESESEEANSLEAEGEGDGVME